MNLKVINTLSIVIILLVNLVGLVKRDLFDLIPFVGGYISIIPFILGIFLIASNFTNIYSEIWITAQPNEWLLIIQGGKLVKAGMGLQTLKFFWQTYVKFPAAFSKVQFDAMQITTEMQGATIRGFAIYSVDRDIKREGPFRYYKNMTGYNAEDNVRQICESTVRHHVANSTLEQLLQDRDKLKLALTTDITKSLSGWGVWLESIEITDVRICSKSLFEDLQAAFRSDEQLKAQVIQLKTNNEISISSKKSDFEKSKNITKNETQRIIKNHEQELKRLVKNADSYRSQVDSQIQLMDKEYEQNLEERQKRLEIENAEANNTIQEKYKLQKIKDEFLMVDKMNDVAFQKYEIDQQMEILANLPLKNIEFNNYIKPSMAGIRSIVPGMYKK